MREVFVGHTSMSQAPNSKKQTSKLLQQLAQLFPNQPIAFKETLQELWSGYGSIARYGVGKAPGSVIVKTIAPPPANNHQHPRGWNTQRSHQRKLHSYQVESQWYLNWGNQCDEFCKVPATLGLLELEDEQQALVLEDLDAAGYDIRHTELTPNQCKPCLRWLAAFHATFLHQRTSPNDNDQEMHTVWPQGLWQQGSYWHLQTRPDEWQTMADSPLKHQAAEIDRKLESGRYHTLIHGDAKVANFCFNRSGNKVAAVDFQYVGGGCGIKDVMYFLGSCLSEQQLSDHYDTLLDHYFHCLSEEVQRRNLSIELTHLEQEWRQLSPLAWADFQRFLEGWSPAHKKNHRFSQQMTQLALTQLGD